MEEYDKVETKSLIINSTSTSSQPISSIIVAIMIFRDIAGSQMD